MCEYPRAMQGFPPNLSEAKRKAHDLNCGIISCSQNKAAGQETRNHLKAPEERLGTHSHGVAKPNIKSPFPQKKLRRWGNQLATRKSILDVGEELGWRE